MKYSYRIKIILHTILAVMSVRLIAVPNFHLKNNAKESIQVQINDGTLTTIAAGSDIKNNINIQDISVLNIYYCPTSTYCKTNKPDLLQVTFGSVQKDTTLYVKFDVKKGKGVLEPQKGDWFGKSTEGYSLSKNITAKNIIQEVKKTTSAEQTFAPKAPKVTESNLIEEEAWKQFPAANKLRKEKVSDREINQYNKYPKEVWFKVLDASLEMPKSELKSKYRKLAVKWHPDRNQDKISLAKAVIQILNAANEQIIEGEKVFVPRTD
jgi:hypothetical protein